MADGDKVQKGQQWKVEYGAFAYTGYMPTDWTLKVKDADDEVIRDHRNATVTHILTDPRTVMSGNLLIKSTGSITPPAKGSYVQLQGPIDVAAKYYYVVDATVTFSSGVSKLSLSLILEDSQSDGAALDDITDDYNTSTHADVTGTITFNSATSVTGIKNITDDVALVLTTDYTVVGTTLTLVGSAHLQTYITAGADSIVLEVSFDLGAPVYWTITGV